jgi:hypothetical protein
MPQNAQMGGLLLARERSQVQPHGAFRCTARFHYSAPALWRR